MVLKDSGGVVNEKVLLFLSEGRDLCSDFLRGLKYLIWLKHLTFWFLPSGTSWDRSVTEIMRHVGHARLNISHQVLNIYISSSISYLSPRHCCIQISNIFFLIVKDLFEEIFNVESCYMLLHTKTFSSNFSPKIMVQIDSHLNYRISRQVSLTTVI